MGQPRKYAISVAQVLVVSLIFFPYAGKNSEYRNCTPVEHISLILNLKLSRLQQYNYLRMNLIRIISFCLDILDMFNDFFLAQRDHVWLVGFLAFYLCACWLLV